MPILGSLIFGVLIVILIRSIYIEELFEQLHEESKRQTELFILIAKKLKASEGEIEEALDDENED